MDSTKAMVRVEARLAAPQIEGAPKGTASNPGDHLQTFIELVEECGIDGVAEFLAQACEVEAENVDDAADVPRANQWLALAPRLRRIAQRAASLYAAAKPTVIEGTFEEETSDVRK